MGLNWLLANDEWSLPISREESFSSLVIHELLHVWVDENIHENSLLLKKYANELSDTREHIHLMALQKMVYLRLNRSDMVAMLDESYRKFASPAYKRAWEIVNDIEGYEAVIQDIKMNLKK